MHLKIHDIIIVGGTEAAVLAALSLADRGRSVVIGGTGERVPDHAEWSPLITVMGDAEDIAVRPGGYTVYTAEGDSHAARALLFEPEEATWAAGIPGASVFAGRFLHQCPHCDGWDHRGRKLGVLGSGDEAVDLARKLLRWSPQVTIFEDPGTLESTPVKQSEKRRIHVRPGRVTALEGEPDKLAGLRFEDGSFETCDALFFPAARKYHTSLASRLGCDLERVPGALEWHPGDHRAGEGIFLLDGKARDVAASALDWLTQDDRPQVFPEVVFQNLRNRCRTAAVAAAEQISPPMLAAANRESV